MNNVSDQLFAAVKTSVANRVNIAELAESLKNRNNIVAEDAYNELLGAVDLLYNVEAIIANAASQMYINELTEAYQPF